MANNFYSMDKYKELIEKFQITFNNDKPIVKLRSTEQTVVAQNPEQEQKLDNLIFALEMNWFNVILIFVEAEKQEIKDIIERLYKDGVSSDDIVKNTVLEIKNSASQGLRETWETLSANFNGSHKYFYLAREYLGDISNNVLASLSKENDGDEMTK